MVLIKFVEIITYLSEKVMLQENLKLNNVKSMKDNMNQKLKANGTTSIVDGNLNYIQLICIGYGFWVLTYKLKSI